jgi:hypothetical protein
MARIAAASSDEDQFFSGHNHRTGHDLRER